jgi:hypothetical protein
VRSDAHYLSRTASIERALKAAFDFVVEQRCGCGAARPILRPKPLIFTSGTWWLTLITVSQQPSTSVAAVMRSTLLAAHRDPDAAVHGISPQMSTLISRISTRVLHCKPTLAAVLRISYDTQEVIKRGRAAIAAHKELCISTLRAANAAARRHAQHKHSRCPHVLATDWFVHADLVGNSAYEDAMRQCWHNAMVGTGKGSSTPPVAWWWLDNRMLDQLVAGLPAMERALQHDEFGLRAMLDVAIAAEADVCLEHSHIAWAVTNVLRAKSGKPPCVSVHGERGGTANRSSPSRVLGSAAAQQR